MPEVIFPGPEGRLDGRYQPGTRPRAPVAIILHPHPGTMNNHIVHMLYNIFTKSGFATLRFNFPGLELAFRISEFFDLPIEVIFSRQPFRPLSATVYGRSQEHSTDT